MITTHPIDLLTSKQRHLLDLAAQGLTVPQIAATVGVNRWEEWDQLEVITDVLGARDLEEAVAIYVEANR